MGAGNAGGVATDAADALQQFYAAMSAAAEAEHYTPIDLLERSARGRSTSVDELLALLEELPPQSAGR